jgi:hypothetical protein
VFEYFVQFLLKSFSNVDLLETEFTIESILNVGLFWQTDLKVLL